MMTMEQITRRLDELDVRLKALPNTPDIGPDVLAIVMERDQLLRVQKQLAALKCEICSKPAAGVASSAFGAISHAYCSECVSANREVWGTLVGGLIGCRRGDVAAWAQPMITATCAFYGKTEDDLWREIEAVDARYEAYCAAAVSESVANHFVFCDLETLGLENNATIVEIGMMECDVNLNVLAAKQRVIHATPRQWEQAGDFVQRMHTASGLRQESLLADGNVWRSDVEREFITWLKERGFGRGEAVIVGNSIGQDRIWLAMQMPELHQFLSYRMVDVTAVRTLVTRWVDPKHDGPTEPAPHRVMGDCEAARKELLSYRRLFGSQIVDAIRSTALLSRTP